MGIFSIAAIILTLAPVSASARTLQDLGLTQADVKGMSQEDMDALLNPSQEQLDLEAATIAQLQAENSETGLLPNTVNCFDHYTFGSVSVNVSPSVQQATAGSDLVFGGTIKNDNKYPLVHGKVVVKIFKLTSGAKNINGSDVVDVIDAAKDVTLPADSSVPISFKWKVPAYIESGNYQAVSYFVTSDKFNLLGLTFTDDIKGNATNFTISGSNESIRFNKDEVFVNDQEFFFAAYPPHIAKNVDATVRAQIVNNTSKNQSVPVKWKVYAWDAQAAGNFIGEYTENVSIAAGKTAEVKYTFGNKSHPVYYVVAEVGYMDTKSVIGVRFARDGIFTSRINFPSIAKYPLVKDKETEVFSCLHAMSDATMANGKMVLTVKGPRGNVLHSYEYVGPVTSAMMGVKSSFVPKDNYNSFTVVAELYQKDQLIDKAEINYDCKVLDPGNCKKSMDLIWGIGALIILLLMILITAIMKRKKKMPVVAAIFMFALGISAMGIAFAPNPANAATVQNRDEIEYNTTVANDTIGTSAGPGKKKLNDVRISVKYHVEVSKENGQVLSGGETVPVGTRLNFKFVPHRSDDVEWFGTGGIHDSPFGEWRAGAAAPGNTCDPKDFTNADAFISGFMPPSLGTQYMFWPLVVAPPVKTLTNTQNLSSCTAVNASGVVTCEVTAEGPVAATFNYAPTFGEMYFRYKTHPGWYGTGKPLSEIQGLTCHAANNSLYHLTVPAQSITYTLTASNNISNQPPTAPVISGPRNGAPGQSYDFGFLSTDPDGDTIQYAIDWDNDGMVNTFLPGGSSFVAQNVQQTGAKAWSSTGTYTFKAMAQDVHGLSSAWSTYNVVISNDTPPIDPPIDPPITGGCTPGSTGCANSCAYVPAIASGDALSSAGLCLGTANMTNFGPNSSGTGWSWRCQASWQSTPQNCEALCASNIYSPAFGVCVDTPFDICVNLDGDQTDPTLYDIPGSMFSKKCSNQVFPLHS